MTTHAVDWATRSQVVTDDVSRERKADHIVRTIEALASDLADKDVLDIGTGSGHIASRLAKRARSVLAVDIADRRVVRDFEFRVVDSEMLPCEDASRDIVLSNHVVEHVEDQSAHLHEVARVLRPGGFCYLATPNRLWLMEPHFRLPLLSWLPRGARDAYVRAAGRGNRYDVQPLTFGGLCAIAGDAGLAVEDISMLVARRQASGSLAVCVRAVAPMWPLLRWAAPSIVVALRKQS